MTDYHPPLTPAEQAALAELNFRDALARWQEGEDTRLTTLATLVHIDGLIDVPAAIAKLNMVESAVGSIEMKNRVSRIRTILGTDLAALMAELDRVREPAPLPVLQPVVPEEPPA